MTVQPRTTPKSKCCICGSRRHRSQLVKVDEKRVAHTYHEGVKQEIQNDVR